MRNRHAVTVVVSTRNRAHCLPRLFDALAAQTWTDFDLVIVDDGSDDDTPSVLKALAAAAPFSVEILRGRGDGPAVGRNLGWRAAAADVVAFTDDDCVPSADWLAAGVRALDGHSIVVGRTEPNPAQLGHLGPFSRTLSVKDLRFFQTCNAFYHRADLVDVDGFDGDFDRPGGEDTDLALRVLAYADSPAAFADHALVHHDVTTSDFRAAVRVAARWTGVPRLFAKHPSIRDDYLLHGVFWKPSHPRVLLAWLGLVVGVRHRSALALVLPWLWFGRSRHVPGVNRRKVLFLPGVFVVDSVEVVAMVRGSARSGTIVL